MHAETLYTINGGELIALTPGVVMPRGLGSAIAFNLESFIEDPGLSIGSWDQTVHDDRPAAMSFTAQGTIVSVVVANMDGDSVPLAKRIEAIHAWLSPMQLRDLSQLFTEPVAFYEGLWDMSPNATIALQETRRYVVVTADKDTTSIESIPADLGNALVDVVHLDVFTSDSGDDPIIRWSPGKGQPLASPTGATDGASTAMQMNSIVSDPSDSPESSGNGPRVSVAADESTPPLPDPSEVVAARDRVVPAVVDVSDVADESVETAVQEGSTESAPAVGTPRGDHEAFIPGRTYQIGTLPQLFDPNDDRLESISDEMFAVPGHLVLVDKLPERRRQPSPFENPGRYRWDADAELQTMLESNLTDRSGSRVLHLFVESDRQPSLATYVGLLTTASDNKAGRYSTSMWFDIDPKVNAPLWQLFRKGRLPDIGDGATADLSTTQA